VNTLLVRVNLNLFIVCLLLGASVMIVIDTVARTLTASALAAGGPGGPGGGGPGGGGAAWLRGCRVSWEPVLAAA